MREDLRLFINEQEVEFTTGPKIYYNYKLTDLTNPTIVKNSYSKSIEIPGTQRNNDIFGHIWNLERVQFFGTGGVGFNPLLKTPFVLYVNGNLTEKGYCKLDSISKKGAEITYTVHLYGGLGSFLYSLAYDESGIDERQRTLADLKYDYDFDNYVGEPDLDYRINKDTVADAWVYVAGIYPDDSSFEPSGDSDKWRVINFAPCYNGIPEDFDADKVLCNESAIPNTILQKQVGTASQTTGILYRTVLNGQRIAVTGATSPAAYSLGEIGEAVTEWETKDLRSYLQRPIVSVRRVIQACKNPEINGGYDFQLSPKFFDALHNEFYYGDAWMTLPMLKDLEMEGAKEAEITGATMTSGSPTNTVWSLQFTTPQGLGQVNGARVTIEPRLVIGSGESQPSELHFSRYWYSRSSCINIKTVRKYWSESVYIVQLIGRNADREIVSQSKAYYFSEAQKFPNGENITNMFWKEGDEGTKPEYVWMKGYFKKVNGEYRFCNDNGQYIGVDFDIPAGQEIATLEFKTMTAIGMGYEAKWDFVAPNIKVDPVVVSDTYLYNSKKRTGTGCYEADAVVESGKTDARIVLNLNSFYGKALDYESMFSDTLITKEKLLSTPFTPADFLLSYAKMFGLYFYYDPAEVSEDPDTYPNGVVHLLDRTEYYQMWDEDAENFKDPVVVNLEKYIDRSKAIDITPAMADAKFYKFEQEPVESEGNSGYYDTYGYNYGRQLVNTSYNFDNSAKDLYESNAFKSGLMCLEKDKYFRQTVEGVEPYVVTGQFHYHLYGNNLDDARELLVEQCDTGGRLNPNSALTGYDLVAKMQFHNANNEASDGAYVLCTFLGTAECNVGGHYYITDDVSDMIYLNGGNPCWLMTPNDFVRGGARIAWHIPAIPVFSRDQWLDVNYHSGVIVNSWNFGHPREILCPFTYTSDGDSIYDKYWKNYIKSLYSVDTRKLSCYVNLPVRPSAGAMRNFYWFDNSIWCLNEVKDWNVYGYNSTQCEFVKVMDTNDYRTPKPSTVGVIELYANPTILPHSGGDVTISIKNQTGANLFTEDDDFYVYGTGSKGGSYTLGPVLTGTSVSGTYITFTVSVPEYNTTEEIVWSFNVESSDDMWHGTSFTQLGGATSSPTP